MNGTIKLIVRNTQTTGRRLVLEPWGGEYELAPGDALEVVLSGNT